MKTLLIMLVSHDYLIINRINWALIILHFMIIQLYDF